uniref:Uncharacterized protein n=1 Tax=Bicosoecida sp. CB-2014 TaxID=1486930 RepID=A0A7S1GCS0_9STRA|mmetsp:Transcript_5659/g.20280  ORF Transcript_5659/g.20280 Transcript_5659/m.20280 type:complete len:517 (+) Transcript_5659:105-1655(+)
MPTRRRRPKRQYVVPKDEDKAAEVQRVLDGILTDRVAPSKYSLFRGVVTLFPRTRCGVDVRLEKARDPYQLLIRVVALDGLRRGEILVGRRTIADALTNLHYRQLAEAAAEAADAAAKEATVSRSVFRDGGRRRFNPEVSPMATRRMKRAAEAAERKRQERRFAAERRKKKEEEAARNAAEVRRRAVLHAQGLDDAPPTVGAVARMKPPKRTTPMVALHTKQYKAGKAKPPSRSGRVFRTAGGEWGRRSSPRKHVSTPGLGDAFEEDAETAERRQRLLGMIDDEEEYHTPRPARRDLVYERVVYPVLPNEITWEDMRVFCTAFVMAHKHPDDASKLRVVLASETFEGSYGFDGSPQGLQAARARIESRRSTSCLSHNPITMGRQCDCPFCREMQEALKPRVYTPRSPPPEKPPPTPPPKLPAVSRPVRSWYVPEQPIPPWERWREDVRVRQTGGDRWEVARFERTLPPMTAQEARILPDDQLLYDYLLTQQPTLRRLRSKGVAEWVRIRSPEHIVV